MNAIVAVVGLLLTSSDIGDVAAGVVVVASMVCLICTVGVLLGKWFWRSL